MTLLIFILYILVFMLWLKQDKLSHELYRLEGDKFSHDSLEKNKISRELCYKMRIILEPNWDKWVADLSNKAGISSNDYVEYFVNNKELKIDRENSLYYSDFEFIVFNNRGMIQIWSEYKKQFTSKIEIMGQMFSFNFGNDMRVFQSKYKEAVTFLVITPNEFGFKDIYPSPEEFGITSLMNKVDRTREFAEIPSLEIISFFEDLYLNGWDANHAIKSFPKSIIDKLEKCNVVYNKSFKYRTGEETFSTKCIDLNSGWAKNNKIELYEETLAFHRFDTPLYSVSIKLDFYDNEHSQKLELR